MKKVAIILTIIAIAFCSIAHAQRTQRTFIDSLKQVINTNNQEDTLKAQTLWRLGQMYQNINELDSSLTILNQSLKLAQKLKHSTTIISIYGSIGAMYLIKSDPPKALINFQNMLREAQEIGNKQAESLALQRIGKLYETQTDYEKALEFYQKADQIEAKLNNLSSRALVLNNIGNAYSYLNKFDTALNYQLQSLELRKQQGNTQVLGYSYNDIAFIYSRMDSLETAKTYYQKSLDIFLQTNRKWEIGVISHNLSSLYLNLNEIDKAIIYGEQGYKAAIEIGSNSSIFNNAITLSLAYNQKKEFKKAYEYAAKSLAYQDSLFNEQNEREIGRLESRLELEKKEAENQKQQNIINLQRQTNIAIGVGLGIALIFAFFLLRGRKLLKEKNNALKLSNEQINQQKEEILTQSENLKEAYEEIKQINEEISTKHDELNERNLVIEKKNHDIMGSINYGSRIQNALLPFHSQIAESFNEFFILFKPRDIVSGDFYWFEQLGDKQILASVDCTGHGVPGAFMSMLGVGALDDAVLRQGHTAPEKILSHLDKYIQNVLQQEHTENKDGMEMSICTIDKSNNTLTFAGARHHLYYFQDNVGTLIKGDRLGVGGMPIRKEKVFTQKSISIETPTTIYVYTDGYPDQFGGDEGRKFMSKRLRRLIDKIQLKPLQEQKEILESQLADWMENQKQVDDILIIGMRIS